jgi:hypothetical protein
MNLKQLLLVQQDHIIEQILINQLFMGLFYLGDVKGDVELLIFGVFKFSKISDAHIAAIGCCLPAW